MTLTLQDRNGPIEDLLDEKSGIMLDIGCGENKQPGFVGLDVRSLSGVDIVWDIQKFPWPLPDESVTNAVSSHLVEHIPPFMPDPKLLGLIRLLLDRELISQSEIVEYIGLIDPIPTFIGFMNEVWRILKPGARFAIGCPHGRSNGFLQDPTHINEINETTWAYFDPHEPRTNGLLWSIYKPKPWQIVFLNWSPEANIEVILEKREHESNISKTRYE